MSQHSTIISREVYLLSDEQNHFKKPFHCYDRGDCESLEVFGIVLLSISIPTVLTADQFDDFKKSDISYKNTAELNFVPCRQSTSPFSRQGYWLHQLHQSIKTDKMKIFYNKKPNRIQTSTIQFSQLFRCQTENFSKLQKRVKL